jgi:O-antigen/teichoic acid export membrane protein
MKTAIRNAISLYISLLFTFLLNLVQLKILTLYLSKGEVGLFFAAAGISLIIGSIYQMGFPLVFARYIPKYEAEKRLRDSAVLYWLSIFSFLSFALPTLIIMKFLIIKLFHSPIIEILPLAFSAYLFFFLISISSSYFAGLRKMHFSAIFNILPFIFYNLLLFFLRNVLTVQLAFYSLLISSIPVFLISILLIKPPLLFKREIYLEIRNFWSFSILKTFLTPFFHYMDRVFIAAFLPLEALAVYMVARRVDQAIRKVLTIPLNVMAPEVSFYWEKKSDSTAFSDALSFFSKIYVFLGFFSFLLLSYLGKGFILLISTEAYLEAYPYLLVLLGSIIIATLYTPYTLVARSLGRMDLYFYSDLLWVVSYFISFPLFAWKFGLMGAALTVLFSSSLTMFFVLFFIRPKIVSFPYSFRYILLISAITFIGFISSLTPLSKYGIISIPLLLFAGIFGIGKKEWRIFFKGMEGFRPQ